MQSRLISSAAPLIFAALSLAPTIALADPPKRPVTVPTAYSRPRVAERPRPLTPPRPAPPPAVAASTPSPLVVTIEVREIRAGARTMVERFSFPVTERGASRIDSRVGDLEYRITVHREGGVSGAPLSFDIRKLERLGKTSSESKVSASVRMTAGQPVVIAAMDRADGSRTEVLAELK
ncbi:MAG: hypothetical protein HYZ29_02510 [Myxococcales bacterium]|nr:hypothetical protein [Myxococcales bacterium]